MEPWQRAFKLLPNPARQVFTGRIFQPVDLIKVIMVETQAKRLERISDHRVVNKPAGNRLNLSANCNFALEGMTVQPRTFVLRGNARQPVSRFEAELFDKLDDHRGSILALRLNVPQTPRGFALTGDEPAPSGRQHVAQSESASPG